MGGRMKKPLPRTREQRNSDMLRHMVPRSGGGQTRTTSPAPSGMPVLRTAPPAASTGGGATAAGSLFMAGSQLINNGVSTTVRLDIDSQEVGLNASPLADGITLDKVNRKLVIDEAGLYLVTAQVGWEDVSTAGDRYLEVFRQKPGPGWTNWSIIVVGHMPTQGGIGYPPYMGGTAISNFAAGEKIYMRVSQTTGGALRVLGDGLTWLSAVRLGDLGSP